MRPRGSCLRFGPYRLHSTQGLSRDGHEIRVTPKSLSLLQVLAARAGEIVTKDELFGSVWPDTVVTESALSSCIRELRRALEDDARRPSYIETVHRRGYRLLTPCRPEAAEPAGTGYAAWPKPVAHLVGREHELGELGGAYERVAGGATRFVAITGEDGIGKTALVEAFVAGLSRAPVCMTGCDEDAGTGDAYRPLLDALVQLHQASDGGFVESVLRRRAPSWLAELSCAGTPEEQCAMRQRTSGATAPRMWRELRDAFETLSEGQPLVLVIEDLQWGDAATLDWLDWFVRDPGDAAVLLVGTIRWEDPDSRGPVHALVEGLTGEDACRILELEPLERGAVVRHLRARLRATPDTGIGLERLEEAIHERVQGHPLFLGCVVEQLERLAAGAPGNDRTTRKNGAGFRADRLPTDARDAIEREVDSLTERERRVLEVASVAGDRFSDAEVAAAAEMATAEVRDVLAGLAGQDRFVRPGPMIAWPDGTSVQGFRFLHPLRRQVLLGRLSPPRRAALHGRIGRRLEAAWGDHAGEIAPVLAAHFEHEADPDRAVSYLHQAGATARRLAAHGVAQRHFRRALALLPGMPAGAERDAWEAQLQTALGRELVVSRGLVDDEAADYFARALQLQRGLDPVPRLGRVLWGLWVFHMNKGPLETADGIADKLLALARALGDDALVLEAQHARWGTALLRGQLSKVLECVRSGMAVCGSRTDTTLAMTWGCTLYDLHLNNHHGAICAGFFSAWADALGGRPEVAARSLDAAVTHARDIGHPFTLALTLVFGAGVRAVLDDAGTCRRHAAEGRAIAEDHRFDILKAWGCVYEGWAMARLGDTASGLSLLNEGLAICRQIGMTLFRPFQLALAADVMLAGGLVKEAARCVEEGLAVAESVGDRLVSAELHRIRGELALVTPDLKPPVDAETELRVALEIAEDQGARLYADRASRALERVWGKRGAYPMHAGVPRRPA